MDATNQKILVPVFKCLLPLEFFKCLLPLILHILHKDCVMETLNCLNVRYAHEKNLTLGDYKNTLFVILAQAFIVLAHNRLQEI